MTLPYMVRGDSLSHLGEAQCLLAYFHGDRPYGHLKNQLLGARAQFYWATGSKLGLSGVTLNFDSYRGGLRPQSPPATTGGQLGLI